MQFTIVEARFVERPWAAPRLVGAKAKGITYQRKVGRELQRHAAREGWRLRRGPWLECTDSARNVFLRQPDFVLERGEALAPLVFEVKLSENEDRARKQLWEYCVALALVLDGAPCGFQVCRSLRPGGRGVPVVALSDAVQWRGAVASLAGTVLWLG